ncbi:hypothetical protein DPMN_013203 [Dreissena polymorpha]|uniref:Uncharacterized protein n=1 Tax=Dreissena polymorpha TaxID=45954 RepID=A0A9D4S3K0_DREPO|nr:hypothetical protein DPMN_013203 [Dreissena polymorpha]
MFKLAQTNQQTNQPTNQPTNQQTNQPTDRAKTICPPLLYFFYYPCFYGSKTFSPSTIVSRKQNVLTKVHENWAKNVSYRLFTCFHYKHKEKTAPPHGTHIHDHIKLIRDIYKIDDHVKNVTSTENDPPGSLFHDCWAKILTSRVLTRNNAPPLCGHVFQRIGNIFELN